MQRPRIFQGGKGGAGRSGRAHGSSFKRVERCISVSKGNCKDLSQGIENGVYTRICKCSLEETGLNIITVCKRVCKGLFFSTCICKTWNCVKTSVAFEKDCNYGIQIQYLENKSQRITKRRNQMLLITNVTDIIYGNNMLTKAATTIVIRNNNYDNSDKRFTHRQHS